MATLKEKAVKATLNSYLSDIRKDIGSDGKVTVTSTDFNLADDVIALV